MWDQIETRSNLQFRSLGIVAVNKTRDTTEIEVYPIEIVPDLADDLVTDTEEVIRQGVGYFEEKIYTTTIKRGSTIPATWLGETNRATSPDVRRGEQVRLFQLGDSDEWFWTSLGRDDDLRRLETVVFTVNANPENTDAKPSPDNTYSMEWSAHDKHITLRTSMANGEHCSYVAQFNLADGRYVVEDSEENHIMMDTKNTHIQLWNKDESYLSLNKKAIVMQSKDTIHLETTDYTMVAKTVQVDCDTYVMNCPDMKMNGDSVFNGNVIVTGSLAVGGLATFSSNVTAEKAMEVGGKLEVKGTTTLKDLKLTGDLTSSGGASFAKNLTAPNQLK